MDPVISRTDATLLVTTDEATLRQLCQEAVRLAAAAVCVYPRWLPILVSYDITACVVISFPHGADSTRCKLAQAEQAIAEGAQELDMVIDLCAAVAGDYQLVAAEVAAVVAAAGQVPVKAIIETGLYSDTEQLITVAQAAAQAGATFVKTSTGFGPRGVSIADITVLRQTLGPDIKLKASGGIRSREFAEQLVQAGADRIGASALTALVTRADGADAAY
jgi:deoxyribose-phosphate aldolase